MLIIFFDEKPEESGIVDTTVKKIHNKSTISWSTKQTNH